MELYIFHIRHFKEKQGKLGGKWKKVSRKFPRNKPNSFYIQKTTIEQRS